MKTAIILFACALAGCTDANTALTDDARQRMSGVAIDADVQTNAAPDSVATFVALMRRDVAVWNDGLVALGCEPPFAFVDTFADDHVHIVLQDVATYWSWTPPNGGGYFDGRDIYLVSDVDGTYDSARTVGTIIAQHELGHALGLRHNDRGDSVMSTVAYTTVSPTDLEDAAHAIGCL